MLRDDIVSGRKAFGAVAEKESHCSSARRQGDLGFFGPGKMQEAFDTATRALKVRLMHDVAQRQWIPCMQSAQDTREFRNHLDLAKCRMPLTLPHGP